MPNETDYAWAAGFFDGEGHTRCQEGVDRRNGYRRCTLRLTLCQVDQAVLRRFESIFTGHCFLSGPYTRSKLNHRDAYYVTAAKVDDVEYILQKMWPYLSQLKQEQATIALTAWKEYQVWLQNKPRTPIMPDLEVLNRLSLRVKESDGICIDDLHST